MAVCRTTSSSIRCLLRPSARTFSTTRRRWAGKEDALNKEGRTEEIEYHKQEQLKKVRESGEGKWEDALASNSESIIKAERGEIDASSSTIEKLQKDSEELLKRQSKQ